MALKSVALAAGLVLGFANAFDVEGMLAAPRRSTGNLSPKGVRVR